MREVQFRKRTRGRLTDVFVNVPAHGGRLPRILGSTLAS